MKSTLGSSAILLPPLLLWWKLPVLSIVVYGVATKRLMVSGIGTVLANRAGHFLPMCLSAYNL